MLVVELLKAVALICQLNVGGGSSSIILPLVEAQKECHRYYAECLPKNQENLFKCMQERK
jgi:hypothetical protein